MALNSRLPINLPNKRSFSFFSSVTGSNTIKKADGSIVDFKNAENHCSETVRKFDFYSWRVGQHFPKAKQPYYNAVNAFFLEVLRSREISREPSICQTRL